MTALHDHDRTTLAAANSAFDLEITIPFHDTETGEARTATVVIDKWRLWQTGEGRAVRGVTVRWREGGGQ
jgi:hypothetical protein